MATRSSPRDDDRAKEQLTKRLEEMVRAQMISKEETIQMAEEMEQKNKVFMARIESIMHTLEVTYKNLQATNKEKQELEAENRRLRQVNAQQQREMSALKKRISQLEIDDKGDLVKKERERADHFQEECRRKDRIIAEMKGLLGNAW
uniref:TACC_C domain-containing protein n=1 Tax=Steinernema glaseri TaxID=37863 RepID=A0A1I8AD63_9BILA